ncbi:MFS transporter [Ralstonia mojiangensis]|uniref:MFS transporter n=1 Tax=Ralstonia mojiangensis TaxID=2953895 RepID=A0ABT2L8H5_9RALS|nr:MFS transporter [Ralstonia mojiangensis]MCO5413535.1 MFS transporter [Ralstonia mojiangensis]MCT7298956.1 MFS transporter [Ralstonia mojiangensis]MCT7311389.1 MFS transporter [Ralstonia mojiangensis]
MSSSRSSRLYQKIAFRILPFLFLCYVLNFIDRVNISFAKLQFLSDLGLSETVFGVATGVFYVSYAAFELPSNLLLARIGAKRTLLRIMVLWGLCTVAQMFVSGAASLYLVRFLLGAAEAGFFPGLMLYLSYWFPDTVRARVNSILLLAVPIAGITGGPLSGWIMSQMQGSWGLHGWQWLFLLEGLPAIVLGLLAPFLLSDRPEGVTWLSNAEREMLTRDLQATQDKAMEFAGHGTLLSILFDRRVLGLTVVYFSVHLGLSTVTFWTPSILKAAGVSSIATIGLLAGLISVFTMVGNVLIAYSSDRYLERRWHLAGCFFATALCLVLLRMVVGDVRATVVLVSIAQLAMFSVPILFWTIPTAQLDRRSAPAGIAMISALGSLGGAFGSALMGTLTSRYGTPYVALTVVAGLLLLGMLLLIRLVPARTAAMSASHAT